MGSLQGPTARTPSRPQDSSTAEPHPKSVPHEQGQCLHRLMHHHGITSVELTAQKSHSFPRQNKQTPTGELLPPVTTAASAGIPVFSLKSCCEDVLCCNKFTAEPKLSKGRPKIYLFLLRSGSAVSCQTDKVCLEPLAFLKWAQ